MKTRLLFIILIVLFNKVQGQWIQLSSPKVSTVFSLVKHHDKAYASINGILCAGDRESSETYAFYPIDGNFSGIRCANSWEDYFIAGTSGGFLTVYSDVSIAYKLRTKSIPQRSITAVEAYGNVILAGTNNGIYLSLDTLKTIQLVSPAELKAVTQFALSDSKWYAATSTGVYVSLDKGNSWTASGLATSSIEGIAVLGDSVYAATSNGLYISNDQGITWKVHPHFESTPIIKLIVQDDNLLINAQTGLYSKPLNKSVYPVEIGMAGEYTGAIQLGRTFIISSFWGIVFKDENEKWKHAVSPFVNEAKTQVLIGNKEVLLAGTDNRGLFASYNGGRSWEMRSPPFDSGAVYGITSVGIVEDYWFASTLKGIYRSSDEGNSWILVNNGLPVDAKVSMYLFDGTRIWIPTNKGLFYSENFGNTWTISGLGITNYIYQIVRHPSGKLIAVTENGWYESNAPYDLWTPGEFQPANDFYNIAINEDTLYATTKGSGLYISKDGGDHWAQVNQGFKNLYLSNVAISKTHAVTVNGVGDIYIKLHKENQWSEFNDNLPLYAGVDALFILEDTVYLSAGFDGINKRALSDYTPVTGIDPSHAKDNTVHIFPNPVTDLLTIENSLKIQSVQILDKMGRFIVSTDATDEIKVDHLINGSYLIKVYWKDGATSVHKFLKK